MRHCFEEEGCVCVCGGIGTEEREGESERGRKGENKNCLQSTNPTYYDSSSTRNKPHNRKKEVYKIK